MAYTTQDIIDAYNQTVGAGTMSEAEFVQLAMSPQYNVTAEQLGAARDVLLGGAPATTGSIAGTTADTTGIASINTTTGAPVDTGAGIGNINATGITTSLPSTTAGTLFTEFGDQSGWNVGATVGGNPAFVRGNDYVVSDEIYWNPNTPLGEDLTNIVQNVQDAGGRAGLTITPYAILDNRATAQDLLNEVKRSGVDFVALDPYLFGDNRFTAEQGIEWTRQAVQALRDIGVDVKLVTQGFVPAGMTDEEVRSYNAALTKIPGVSEVVNFGLEDAPDLQGGGFRALSNPLGRPATVTGEAATTAQDTTLRYTPTTVTDFNRVLQDSSATASDIVAAYNYAVNNPNTSTADKQALQTFAPNIQEFERLSNIGYVKDYENTEYNPLTIVRLADQISRNLDLSSSTGGVFGTKGQSVGFDYDEATRLLGTAPTTVQQVALDMARELARQGITDISQLTTGSYTAPDMELESGSRPGETTTQVFFGDELLGSPTTKGNFFGATYTGEGGTAYNVDIDPQTGKPRFYTSFIETSDRGTIGTLLSFATLAFPGISQAISGAISGALPGAAITGGAGAAGAAAGIGFIPATTFNTVATQALTSGIMSGLGAVVSGGDFEDGFKSGFISGGAGGVVKAVMPTDFAATNPRLANTISSAAGSVLSAAASGRDVGNALTNSLINSAVVNGVQTATGAMGLSASDAATISRIATPIITSLVQTGQASEQTIINAVLSAVGTMAANQSNPTSVLSTLTGSGRTGDDLGGTYERDVTDTLRKAGLTESTPDVTATTDAVSAETADIVRSLTQPSETVAFAGPGLPAGIVPGTPEAAAQTQALIQRLTGRPDAATAIATAPAAPRLLSEYTNTYGFGAFGGDQVYYNMLQEALQKADPLSENAQILTQELTKLETRNPTLAFKPITQTGVASTQPGTMGSYVPRTPATETQTETKPAVQTVANIDALLALTNTGIIGDPYVSTWEELTTGAAQNLAQRLNIEATQAQDLLRLYPDLFGDTTFTPADIETMRSTDIRAIQAGAGADTDNAIIQTPSPNTVIAVDADGNAVTYSDLIELFGKQKSGNIYTVTNPKTGAVTTADLSSNTTTVIDPETKAVTQTTFDTATQTQTEVTTRDGITIQTSVDTDDGVITQTQVDSAKKIVTETKNDGQTITKIVTNPEAGTQTVIITDATTGKEVEKKTTTVPENWAVPKIETPVVPALTPTTTTTTTKTPTTTAPPKTPTTTPPPTTGTPVTPLVKTPEQPPDGTALPGDVSTVSEEPPAPPLPPDEEEEKPPTETPPPPAPTPAPPAPTPAPSPAPTAPPKAPPPAPKPPGKPTIPTGNLAQLLATLAQIDPWYADIDVADLEKLFSGQTPLAMPKKKEKG